MKHDAIVKQGTNRDKIVYTQLSNIKEKRGDAEKLMAPTADEAALTAERTRQAFEKVRTLCLLPFAFVSLIPPLVASLSRALACSPAARLFTRLSLPLVF